MKVPVHLREVVAQVPVGGVVLAKVPATEEGEESGNIVHIGLDGFDFDLPAVLFRDPARGSQGLEPILHTGQQQQQNHTYIYTTSSLTRLLR